MHFLAVLLFPMLAHSVVPGDIVNLTTFTLQTPYASGSTIEQIKWPALRNYNDSVFYAGECPGNRNGCVVFFTPESGATTSGSNYPRSELRENIDWQTPVATSAETHWIAASLRVLDGGPADSICIGQIHFDGISGHCSIVVELEWTSGEVVAHVRDEACSNKNFVVGRAGLGQQFFYNLSMVGDAVQVVTSNGQMAPYHYSVSRALPLPSFVVWALPAPPSFIEFASALLLPNTSNSHSAPPPPMQWFAGKADGPPMYLKAGNYYQGSGSSKKGSVVEFASIQTYHSTAQ